MKLALWMICSALVLAGCVSSNFMPVGDKTYPPRPNDYVIDVFVPTEAPVVVHQQVPNIKPLAQLPANAVTIGRIDTVGAPAAGWASVFNDAKAKARELGGDAIVVKQWGNPLTGVDSYGSAQYGKSISMTVVRLRD